MGIGGKNGRTSGVGLEKYQSGGKFKHEERRTSDVLPLESLLNKEQYSRINFI